MVRGERALLDIQPSYAFLHKDSGLPLPEGLRREAPVVVDVTVRGGRGWAGRGRRGNASGVSALLVSCFCHAASCRIAATHAHCSPPHPCQQLASWLPGAGVRCVGAASDVFLRTLQPGQGWETPRPPFEVQLHMEARAASTTGRVGEGQPYFSTSSGEPLACALGAGQLPPGGPPWQIEAATAVEGT